MRAADCRPTNKAKLEKMARTLETYRQARSWFVEQAEALNTTAGHA